MIYCLFIAENASNHRHAVVRKEDHILAEIEELKNLHGDKLPPYKYRLWAEMIVWFQLMHR